MCVCVSLRSVTYLSPALGWKIRENLFVSSRSLSGKFDMVMMLAVVHHLLVGSQIPLKHIADLCKRLTSRGLLMNGCLQPIRSSGKSPRS